MGISDARQGIIDGLANSRDHEFLAAVNTAGFSFRTKGDDSWEISYLFKSSPNLEVSDDGFGNFFTHVGDYDVVWKSKTDGQHFVDAVHAMNYYLSNQAVADDPAAFGEFQEKAKAWRARKPAPPGEVHRFQVLAENAFQSNDFQNAVNYYEKALAVEPLWPDGQLNSALIYGELKVYSMAMLHMRRYLELSPDAKNARNCRDQMIIWEEKAK